MFIKSLVVYQIDINWEYIAHLVIILFILPANLYLEATISKKIQVLNFVSTIVTLLFIENS